MMTENSETNPPTLVNVRRTDGRVESDWECYGQIGWSDNKQCSGMRVVKTQPDQIEKRVEKWVALTEFLDRNPLWSHRAKQVCEIINVPFE